MTVFSNTHFKKIFSRSGFANLFWIIIGVGIIILLSAAIQRQNHQICSRITVELDKDFQEAFIDENDVINLLNKNRKITQQHLQNIRLKSFEILVKKNPWVKNATLYFDNKNILHVKIKEREPVALVMTKNDDNFYIDSSGMQLPLSDKFAVRVPVFTGYPGSISDKISKPDSLLLRQMVAMAAFINTDHFWSAQIAQINIQPNAEFELVPIFGNQLINFGTADNLEKKFNKLSAFYQQVFTHVGINTYKTIDLRFNNQVVAIKSEYKNISADTAKTKTNTGILWMADTTNVQHNLPLQNTPEQTNRLSTNNTGNIAVKQINEQQNKTDKHTLSDNHMLGVKTNSKKNVKAPKAVMKKQK
ncbi:cell division protein FtsQ/DivIB [Hydrotalea sp.]|uniref:cell division protein FtsQ/DivIB n=1 Tax=Hydrotalea sp. TaxID=2881279 RepID=UPI002617E7BB|nr:cell division protein FtsQ/DivIB [Hydrotalea sp.]